MTVVHMRIDNRLIHGQVTISWVGALRADHLIVCNDQVAQDDIQKMMLPQAARGVRTSVLSVSDTVSYLETEEAEKERIFLIPKFPADALQLLDRGVKPKEINVGNQAPIPGTKFKMVMRTLAATAEDADAYRKIAASGYRLTCKMMPNDRPQDFLEVLQKKGL
jgi:mannose/fructose/N-acetylgalactosamine-specific phosphotransferase system component IIB